MAALVTVLLVAGVRADTVDAPAVASAVAVRGTLPGPFVGGCRVFPTDNAWNIDAYGDESDPGPFPIPLDAPVGGGNDRHVLVVQQGTCHLFELFVARRSGAGWVAESGTRFDLRSNALRPFGWTSADAAGLPILPVRTG